jgi:hypothetical protein
MVKISAYRNLAMLKSFIAPFIAYASKLRFPTLFKLTLALFLIDFFTPDLIFPFIPIDEILLGLSAALLASWKNRKDPINKNDATD